MAGMMSKLTLLALPVAGAVAGQIGTVAQINGWEPMHFAKIGGLGITAALATWMNWNPAPSGPTDSPESVLFSNIIQLLTKSGDTDTVRLILPAVDRLNAGKK